jgi:hypothetical protein
VTRPALTPPDRCRCAVLTGAAVAVLLTGCGAGAHAARMGQATASSGGSGTDEPGTGGPEAASTPGTGLPGELEPATPGVPPQAESPAVPAVPPVLSGAPPAAPAGLLAAWAAPPARAAFSLRLWFAGVPIGRHGAELVVAYPSLSASSDGRTTVAHLKLAVFRCAGRSTPDSGNYRGCHYRQVEYGDLAAPPSTVDWSPAGVVLAGRFPTYRYESGIDRDLRISPKWTGRTVLVRIAGRPAGPVGTGTVTLGAGASAVTAGTDGGYPNTILSPRKVPS